MKKLRLREWLLLILPVLCLAGAAFYWQTRDVPPRPDTGQLRLVITKSEFEPLTPREVALGYDRKLVIEIDKKGALPANITHFESITLTVAQAKIVKSDGQPFRTQNVKTPRQLPLTYSFSEDSSHATGYISTKEPKPAKIFFLLRIREFSEKDAPLQLKLKLKGHSYVMAPTNFPLSTGMKWLSPSSVKRQQSTPKVELSVLEMLLYSDNATIVRKKGESLVPPDISQTIPITFAGSELGGSREQPTVGVTVQHQSIIVGRPGKVKWRIDELHLQDAKGRNYDWAIDNKNTHWGYTAAGWGGAKDGKFGFGWTINLGKVPRKVGALTLKAKISANESWPLDVSVVVRPQWESRVASKILKLKKVTLRKAKASGQFLAHIRFSYSGTKPLHYRNPYDYSPSDQQQVSNAVMLRMVLSNRIEDEAGRIYIYKKTSEGDMWRVQLESVGKTEGTNNWAALYLVETASLPAGHTYSCKVDIGADKIGILPVSIPLPNTKGKR